MIVANIVVFVVADDVIVCLFICQSEDDDRASVTASSVTVSVCVITAESITVHTHWVETDLLPTPFPWRCPVIAVVLTGCLLAVTACLTGTSREVCFELGLRRCS